ncbi:hypothetical protein NSERUTF1_7146 [Nocardia seriolae]|nr:hypothetical protein NSERUTF1_7146 [Nocardia seriolae]
MCPGPFSCCFPDVHHVKRWNGRPARFDTHPTDGRAPAPPPVRERSCECLRRALCRGDQQPPGTPRRQTHTHPNPHRTPSAQSNPAEPRTDPAAGPRAPS